MGELIDVVDDDDRVLGTARRSMIRKNAFLHRVAVVIVLSKSGHFLVQKRSASKDIFPSCWEIGCAETLESGESYEDAAARGLKEELGIQVAQRDMKNSLQFQHKYRSGIHNANYKVYKWISGDFITLQDEEIEEVKFLRKEQIIKMTKEEPFGPFSVEIFNEYLKMKGLGQALTL